MEKNDGVDVHSLHNCIVKLPRNRPLSRGGHFVSLFARLASFSRRDVDENVAEKLNLRFFRYSFVKCRRTPQKLNSKGPLFKFRKRNRISSLFVYLLQKRDIRHFYVVDVQNRQTNVQKSVMHVRSCCFTYTTYYFLDVLAAVAALDLRVILLEP